METTFGFSSASASSKFANFFAPRERLRQFAVGDVALADPDDFEAGNARIGQGMAHAHVAEADDENSLDHLFPLPVSLDDPRRSPSPARGRRWRHGALIEARLRGLWRRMRGVVISTPLTPTLSRKSGRGGGAGDRDGLACERHAALSIAARPSAIQFRLASLIWPQL